MFPANFFKNIRPVANSTEQLRGHILWFLFIRVVLYTILLGITLLLHTEDNLLILPPTFFIFVYILCIYAYSIGSAVLLQHRRLPLKGFALLQVLSDVLFISLLVYATGASQSIFTAVFILPIISAGLILYRASGLLTAAVSTIAYGFILTCEYIQALPSYYHDSQHIPVEDYALSMNIFAVYGLTFFLLALLSGILASRLRSTEAALTMSELKFDRLLLLYKQIFDDIMTGIITVDEHNRITSINPAATNITGFDEAQVLGKRIGDVFPFELAENTERAATDLVRQDGHRIRIGFSCSELHMGKVPAQRDPEGISCKVITLQDISRIEQMENQMRQAEKMAAIGEMSASIAHDLRNPLAAISGSAQILSMEFAQAGNKSNGTGHSLTNIILRESDRLARTITDFLFYARPAVPEPKWFNLARLCHEAIEALKKAGGMNHCRIDLEVPPDLDICADRQLLQQALTSLLKNSCQASADSSEAVVLKAREETGTEGEDDQLLIEITDKGAGFAPELKEKLFEPFFTTRDDSSGMGLAIVKQIISGHFGTIDLRSEPGQGCTATIRLPLPESTP